MITPHDIHHKKFKSSFRGYSPDEVDQFLDAISVDVDQMVKENLSLKDNIAKSDDDIRKYRDLEQALNSALINAEKLAEDIVTNAKNEAEKIMEHARNESKNTLETTINQREEILESIERLRALNEEAKTKLLGYLGEFTNKVTSTDSITDEGAVSEEKELSVELKSLTGMNEQEDATEDYSNFDNENISDETYGVSPTSDEDVQNSDSEAASSYEDAPQYADADNNYVEADKFEDEPVIENEAETESADDIRDDTHNYGQSNGAETEVSNEEKSALLGSSENGKTEGENKGAFSDLGEGVPGIFRKKRKINY